MVLLTILANCIVLALEEHLPSHDKTTLSETLVSSSSGGFSIVIPLLENGHTMMHDNVLFCIWLNHENLSARDHHKLCM